MLSNKVMPLSDFREAVLVDLEVNPRNTHAIWYLNIKKFRFINESYGYDFGDKVIVEFANYLVSRIVGRGMCARLGDDRFVVYISESFYNSELALEKFEELYRAFNLRIREGGIQQPVEIAAGVYFLTPDDLDEPNIDFLIDQANSAHKRARDVGGNHIVFYDYEYAEKQRRELMIESDLTASIAAGEIEVWMQPMLDFNKGEVVASEALARWNHKTLGRLSPVEFIPVLERCGKIAELDRHIWNVACYEAYNRHLETGEDPVPFSVNLSRVEILDPTLPDYLEGLQEKYELPPKTLRLEVTESAYTEQPEELVAAVTELRERGFIVEMDDFGSGYSSLNMLRNLPVDILKLDMGFLHDDKADASDAVILNSVIRMAHGLDIPIIAEGVETIEQAEMLKTMGCHLMQGYFFAKPMPIEQFYKLLNDTKTARHTYTKRLDGDRVAQLLDQRNDTAFFFNYCVGPALIFVAGATRYDIMLANDEVFEELQLSVIDNTLFKEDLLHATDVEGREMLRRATELAIETGHGRCVVRMLANNRWAEFTLRPISSDESGGVVIALVRDATEDHEIAAADTADVCLFEAEQARDDLTGLLTYHALDAIVAGDVGANGGTLILADVDEFDAYASSHVQEAVDMLVGHIAGLMRQRLSNDALLARCGEGLFAAFLPSTHSTVDARANACMIVDALRTSKMPNGEKVTCSLGLASIEAGKALDLAIMYRRALRALTIAKLNGGDGFLLYDTVRKEVGSAIEVFGVQLRHAIDGELLPQKALEGKDLFNIISRDFEEHHAWNMPAHSKRSVRDTVFGALRYRSMAEVPGVLSFDYDTVDDQMFFESVDEEGRIMQRAVEGFHKHLFEYGDKLAEESMARLSALLSDMEYLPSAGNVDLKCRLDHDDEFHWYRFSFTSLRDEKSFVIRGLGYGEDIDLSREAGLWWKDRALHDGLTGLLNREGLEDAIATKLAKSSCGIMFMIDIDNFKDINDRLGHLSGDSVLCELADTLLAMFREGDVVGRFGADEMIAFISGIASRELAHVRAQTLREAIDDISVGDYGNITVSIGVSIIEKDGSFYDFLELADQAVHVSKKHGKDCYTIADEVEERLVVHRYEKSAESHHSRRILDDLGSRRWEK